MRTSGRTGPATGEEAGLAILLAGVAGFVDAVGYLTLFHLFTAHMSGNSAALGAHLGQGAWAEAVHRAVPIPLFVLGVALGAGIIEAAVRQRVRAPFSLALGLEALLLALFMLLGARAAQAGALRRDMPGVLYPLTALPCLAMGLQNATLRRVGGEPVRTTYVSGMLTDFAESAAAYLFWLRDATRGHGPRGLTRALGASARQHSRRRMLLYGSIWSAFLAGAVLGGWTLRSWHLWSIALPLAGLTAAIAWDLARPVELSLPRRDPSKDGP